MQLEPKCILSVCQSFFPSSVWYIVWGEEIIVFTMRMQCMCREIAWKKRIKDNNNKKKKNGKMDWVSFRYFRLYSNQKDMYTAKHVQQLNNWMVVVCFHQQSKPIRVRKKPWKSTIRFALNFSHFEFPKHGNAISHIEV